MAFQPAFAAIDVFLTEEGGNVVATFEGDLDLTGTTFNATLGFNGGINAAFPALNFGPGGSGLSDTYSGFTGPTFGPGNGGFNGSGNGVGDIFAINRDFFAVGVGYAGEAISGSFTMFGESFLSLGIIAGVYIYTLPNDTVTLTVGAAPVPVPAAAFLMAPALAAFAAKRRRQR